MKLSLHAFWAFIAIGFLSFTVPNTVQVEGCSIMKEGTFKYKDDESDTKVVIKNNIHKEFIG